MKWSGKRPEAGDMIRVKLGSIYHYGVFVSDSEIIQFGLAPQARPTLKDSEIEVCTSDLEVFLCGGVMEVAELDEKSSKRSPEEAIAYARQSIGKRGYNILYNNCEHFAYDCVTGKPYCSQTADVRSLFRSLPIVDVYVAAIPEGVKIGRLSCAEREAEIDSVSNPRVKTEKYCVWKLLEYALERSFGLHADKLSFTKNEAGKWTTDKCFFSLSHCDGAVAVAVSRAAVGVDIEELHSISRDRFATKILTPDEYALFEKTPCSEQEHFLLERWTGKESMFKRSDKPAFIPRDHDTTIGQLRTERITLSSRIYALSVATPTPDILRSYIGISLML